MVSFGIYTMGKLKNLQEIFLKRINICSCDLSVFRKCSTKPDVFYDNLFRDDKKINKDAREYKNKSKYTNINERKVPNMPNEYLAMKHLKVDQPVNPLLNRVAILGVPNVGKSTLMNDLMRHQISPVSCKVHTTRQNCVGVFVQDSTQIEFVDTPGMIKNQHRAKYNLEPSFLSHPDWGSDDADMLLIVVDASNKLQRMSFRYDILRLLYKHKNKEAILVLNKTDTVKDKRRLLDVIDSLTCGIVDGKLSKEVDHFNSKSQKNFIEQIISSTKSKLNQVDTSDSSNEIKVPGLNDKGWPHFKEIFLTSALTGEGVDKLRNFLIEKAIPNPWKYNSNIITNQHPYLVAKRLLKEKLLNHLPQEIPYSLTLKIMSWEVNDIGTLFIVFKINCPKNAYMAMLLGSGGQTIARIADQTRESLSNIFHCDVSLKLIAQSTDPTRFKKKHNQNTM